MINKNKLIAIVNKEIEPGVVMNALAHASLAFGAKFGESELFLNNYSDKNKEFNWGISGMPYIILRGSSNEIKKSILKAKECGVFQLAFTDTMTLCGGHEEQIKHTAEKTIEEFIYYCGVLYGDFEKVKEITKRLSLF